MPGSLNEMRGQAQMPTTGQAPRPRRLSPASVGWTHVKLDRGVQGLSTLAGSMKLPGAAVEPGRRPWSWSDQGRHGECDRGVSWQNIILLADGTGNSASSPFKTNVWRLYQALDICARRPADSNRWSSTTMAWARAFKPCGAGPRLRHRSRAQRQSLYTFVPKLQTRRQYLSVRL